MRYGMLGRMGSGMRQVGEFGDWSMEKSNFGGECGAPPCNQWGVCGNVACSQITFGNRDLILSNYRCVL